MVDVVRGRDLVALTVEAYDCEVASGGGRAALRARGDAGDAAGLAFQHVAEAAIYETPRAAAPVLVPDGGEQPLGGFDVFLRWAPLVPEGHAG